MSRERAEADLAAKGFLDQVIRLEALTATVQEAADALGVEPGAIAKTLSFLVGDEPVLILAEGSAKIDNHKFKEQFHTKAKMIGFDELEPLIGHAAGGVCPFGVNDGVRVYLDESLKRFDTVYPAAGTANSAVRLTPAELEKASLMTAWVDVTKMM